MVGIAVYVEEKDKIAEDNSGLNLSGQDLVPSLVSAKKWIILRALV